MTTSLKQPAGAYPSSTSVADRLRSYMGLKKIGRKPLALASGIGRTPLSQKLDGKSEFTLNEVMAVARALGRSWEWLLTGDETDDPTPPGFGLPLLPPEPDGPDDGLLLPRLDSNQEPADVRQQTDKAAA